MDDYIITIQTFTNLEMLLIVPRDALPCKPLCLHLMLKLRWSILHSCSYYTEKSGSLLV